MYDCHINIFSGEESIEISKESTINVSKIATALEESCKKGCEIEVPY